MPNLIHSNFGNKFVLIRLNCAVSVDCTNHSWAGRSGIKTELCVLHTCSVLSVCSYSFKFTMRTLHHACIPNANRISIEHIWISKTFMTHSLICEWKRIACKSQLFWKMHNFPSWSSHCFTCRGNDALQWPNFQSAHQSDWQKQWATKFCILPNYKPISTLKLQNWSQNAHFMYIEMCYFNL